MTATTRRFDPIALENMVYLSFELGEGSWTLSFTSGFGAPVHRRRVPARDRDAVLRQIEAMKERLGLAASCRVVSCYEAGRDGFWLHRFLEAHGIENLVVDSSSIEVSRRSRRAKTDRLDGESLLDLLLRHRAGSQKKVFSVVRVATVEQEDRRHLHRELQGAKRDRTRVTNRMKGLLANQGAHAGSEQGCPRAARGAAVQGSEALSTIAEVGLGLAGFTGILVALGQSPEASSRPGVLRLLLLLVSSLGAVFLALLPFALQESGVSSGACWRLSSALLAVFTSVSLACE